MDASHQRDVNVDFFITKFSIRLIQAKVFPENRHSRDQGNLM